MIISQQEQKWFDSAVSNGRRYGLKTLTGKWQKITERFQMSIKNNTAPFLRDAFISLTIAIMFFALFIAIDFTERWFHFTREYEDFELDELSGLVLGALIGLLFLNFRLLLRSKEDTQEIKALSSEMEVRAYTDYLTELPNRRALQKHADELIAESLASGKEFALMYIDLDSFKYVNDTLGHTVGDALLVEVAKRLSAVKPEDAMLARVGGDEFCLVIPGHVSDQLCFNQCQFLDTRISQPFFIDEHKLHISQTVGISRFPEDGCTFEQLLKTADMAMYQGKRKGQGTHNFSDEVFTEDMQKRFLVLHGLEEAMDKDQFFVVYQPKVNINDAQLVGCEALVRWDHPQHGIIPPNEFIAIAEEANLVHKIDFYVFETVCKHIQQWGAMAYPVAVNLSPSVFSDENLPEKLIKIMNEYGISPDMIEIEITERTIISDSDIPFRVCKALSAAGISLALDDFGTGYSSLSYIDKFPITTIKIDRSFVDKICKNERIRNVVTAIIQLADALNIKVIAEGIETVEQGNILNNLGCNEAQGYYFGKPMPLEEFTELLPT